jgi:hypothetical protein
MAKVPEKVPATVPAVFVIVAVAEESEIALDNANEEAVPVTVQVLEFV